MSTTKDNRRERRISYAAPIRFSWEEHGQQCFAIAKCVDLSETGIRIESLQQVRTGTRILLGAERLRLSGSAVVKHAFRRGSKYILGIQLTQKLGKTIAELEGKPVVTILPENF